MSLDSTSLMNFIFTYYIEGRFPKMSSSSSDELEERLEEAFDGIFQNIHDDIVAGRRKKKGQRTYIERNCEEGHIRLWNDYFSEEPTFLRHLFRRRFRMNKDLFMRIAYRL